MFLPVADYQVIDINNQRQAYTVVVEATSQKEIENYLKTHGLAECDVFKEYGEELYRGICKVTTVKSDEDNLVTRK